MRKAFVPPASRPVSAESRSARPQVATALAVMLVDDQAPRAALLAQALTDQGFVVVARLSSAQGLVEAVGRHQPDVIIIDVDSPDRDTLDTMAVLHRDAPRPVVMFTADGDSATIHRAVSAGVSAYVADGLQTARVRPIIDVAIARFREYQALRNELEATRTQLVERKRIDQAKAVLIKTRGMSEEQAYHAMRRMAMDRGQRLGEVAANILAVMNLLEGERHG